MAYDAELADRLRQLLHDEPGLSEKVMFGGLGFLVDGNMAVSASGQGGLMVRADPDLADALLQEGTARPFEMRGRGMRGWLHLDAESVGTDDELRHWVGIGVTYARSLPGK